MGHKGLHNDVRLIKSYKKILLQVTASKSCSISYWIKGSSYFLTRKVLLNLTFHCSGHVCKSTYNFTKKNGRPCTRMLSLNFTTNQKSYFNPPTATNVTHVSRKRRIFDCSERVGGARAVLNTVWSLRLSVDQGLGVAPCSCVGNKYKTPLQPESPEVSLI